VFYFLLSRQRGLSATYPAPILTIFETTDVNRFCLRTPVKNFPISAQGIFQVPKTAQNTVLYWWGVCDRAAAQTAQLWAMGIISGGVVDIPRMCLLYVTFVGGRTVWAL